MWRDWNHDMDRDRPDPVRAGQTARDPEGDASPDAVFSRDLDLPRGSRRERVYVHSRSYDLRGSESRMLATIGAFRVVPAGHLHNSDRGHVRDVRHLRDLGLVRAQPYVIGHRRTSILTLTPEERALLEHARGRESRQTFYAGVRKPRELAHDAHLYRAYERAAERLVGRGARVRRVVLEEELKRAYQQFLHPGARQQSGRSQRDADEIAQWARTQQLPTDDGHIQFPDLRIEYDDRDGRRVVEDVEITTPHYRGAHAASKARAGFTCYRAIGACLGGLGRSTRGGGHGFDPRVAEDVLR